MIVDDIISVDIDIIVLCPAPLTSRQSPSPPEVILRGWWRNTTNCLRHPHQDRRSTVRGQSRVQMMLCTTRHGSRPDMQAMFDIMIILKLMCKSTVQGGAPSPSIVISIRRKTLLNIICMPGLKSSSGLLRRNIQEQ